MLRRLERDSIKSDLAAIEKILQTRTRESDPIGYLQFKAREEALLNQLKQLDEIPELGAGVALFFGGEPVLGSKGIRVDFASKAIEVFQDLVSKKFAATELGVLGGRGPVAMKANSNLMLTDVARGSFGLVLEEADVNQTIAETPLRQVVSEVANLLEDVVDINPEKFETVLDELDTRVLSALREFFTLLDEQKATVRLVEDDAEQVFDRVAIHRGRERTAAVEVEEAESDMITGKLYLLPAHRRFELVLSETGETLYGAVSSEFSKEHLKTLQQGSDIVGKEWRTRMRIRETRRPNQAPKLKYLLLGLLEEVNPARG